MEREKMSVSKWAYTDIGVDGAYFDYKELIRCKDCKWFRTYYDGSCDCEWLVGQCYSELELGEGPEDYCSHGERKS